MLSVPVKFLRREIAQVYGVQSFEKWKFIEGDGFEKENEAMAVFILNYF